MTKLYTHFWVLQSQKWVFAQDILRNMNTKTKRSPKKPKVPGVTRHVLADNVRKLLGSKYPTIENKNGALAKDAGISLSSVQRVLQAETGPSLDNVELLAIAFDVQVYQLLLPNLDVENPQIVRGASAAERKAYALMARASRNKPESTDG